MAQSSLLRTDERLFDVMSHHDQDSSKVHINLSADSDHQSRRHLISATLAVN